MNRKPHSSPLSSDHHIPFDPWVYGGVFLVSLALLSYIPLSLKLKLWIGSGGLALPFLLALWAQLDEKRKKGPLQLDPIGEIFPREVNRTWLQGLFICLIFLLLLTRFYHLTSIPFWPMGDEGINSMRALGLMKKWNWSPIWGDWVCESLLTWSMALYFKLIGPSLISLRLYTVLLSLATVGLSYFALRTFFPVAFSLVFSWLLAFSFPELMLARQCTPNDLIPPFQFCAFLLLGLLWKKSTEIPAWSWLVALAFCCGAGFYTYVNWVVVWLFILMILIVRFPKKPGAYVFFALITVLIALPLIAYRLRPSGLHRIHQLFLPIAFVHYTISYLKGIFWEGSPSYPFGPIWGGLLDPVTGTLFLLGLLWAVRIFRRSRLLLGGFGFFLSLLPGVLSGDLELQRITPATPWLIGAATLGLFCLTRYPWKYHRIFEGMILSAPLFLNFYQYMSPYDDLQRAPAIRQMRTLSSAHAYQILHQESQKNGPLYVFSEFNLDYDDKTLNVPCYPFDALQNPALSGTNPQWCALILNIDYVPFLQKRFSVLKFERLALDSSLGLFLIPTSVIPADDLTQWLRSDRFYRDLNFGIKGRDPNSTWGIFLGGFSSLDHQISSDPLMKTIYWEKVAFFRELAGDYPGTASAYQKAIEQGYPLRYLYSKWGKALEKIGKTKEARDVFERGDRLEDTKDKGS